MPNPSVVALFLSLFAASLVTWLWIARRLSRRQEVFGHQPAREVGWNAADVVLLCFLWLYLEIAVRRLLGVETKPGELSTVAVAALAGSRMIWVFAAVAYLVARTRRSLSELGFDLRRLATDIRLGVITFLAAFWPVFGLQGIVGHFIERTEHPLQKWIEHDSSPSAFGWAIVSAVVVAPLAEELFFRVVLQGWLERRWFAYREQGGFVAALARGLPIVLSATLFAAFHQFYDWGPLFVLALFLGFIYQRTQRIYAPMVTHVCVNSLAIVGLLLGAE